MKKSTICTRNARTFFVRAVSVSIIDQLKLYDSFCLCLANVHLPYLLHLVFSFQLLGHAVSLRQRLHDQFHAVLCRFVNLGAILPYAHPEMATGVFFFLPAPGLAGPERGTAARFSQKRVVKRNNLWYNESYAGRKKHMQAEGRQCAGSA